MSAFKLLVPGYIQKVFTSVMMSLPRKYFLRIIPFPATHSTEKCFLVASHGSLSIVLTINAFLIG